MKLKKLMILLTIFSSVLYAGSSKWAPIMMGDITTFVPYVKSNQPPIPPDNSTLLTSGQSKNGIADKGKYKYYKIYAHAGDTVKIDLYNMDANGNLYVKVGSQASINTYDYKSENGGKTHSIENDSCSIKMAVDGYVYIAVYAPSYGCDTNVQHTIVASTHTIVDTPTVTTNKTTYASSESVTVSVTNMPGNKHDWVAIFRAGAKNTFANIVSYQYTVGVTEGDFDLGKVKDPGQYEARIFAEGSWKPLDTYAFSVASNGSREFGTEGPYLDKVKSIKTSEDGKVNNAIYYVEGEVNLPTVIFMSGPTAPLKPYDGFLRYIASLGYCVIAKQVDKNYYQPQKEYKNDLKKLLNKVVQAPYYADTSKLGIIGYSAGGGMVFYLMNALKQNIIGSDKSVVMSIDGWFPFGVKNESLLNNFDTPTLLMQFGGYSGTTGKNNEAPKFKFYQDTRINLNIFKSLTDDNIEKEYIVLKPDNHHYIKGSYDEVIVRKDLLAPIDEFLYTMLGTGHKMKLIDEHDKVKVLLHPDEKTYKYKCHRSGFNFCDLNNLTFP